MPLRVGTWNVFHGNLTSNGVTTTPLQRMVAFADLAWAHGADIVALQEVPNVLINAGFNINPNGANGWTVLSVAGEYAAGSTPASTTYDGYVILYRAATIQITSGPGFYAPGYFNGGHMHFRPPLAVTIRRLPAAAVPAEALFLAWHNETGVWGTTNLGNLVTALGAGVGNVPPNAFANKVVAGDLNVQEGALQGILGTWSAEGHYVDWVLASSAVAHVAVTNLHSDANHMALLDDVNFPGF